MNEPVLREPSANKESPPNFSLIGPGYAIDLRDEDTLVIHNHPDFAVPRLLLGTCLFLLVLFFFTSFAGILLLFMLGLTVFSLPALSLRDSCCILDRKNRTVTYELGGYLGSPYGGKQFTRSFKDMTYLEVVQLKGRGGDSTHLRLHFLGETAIDVSPRNMGLSRKQEIVGKIQGFLGSELSVKTYDAWGILGF